MADVRKKLNERMASEGYSNSEIDTQLTTHAALTTGVHGVGASILASIADVYSKRLDDGAAPEDNTDLDATTAAHGLMPKADKVKLDAIEASADVTDAVNVGTSIHGVADKNPPIDADKVPLIDTAASNVLKTSTWTNIKAFLKTYFDTVYTLAGLGGVPTTRTITATTPITIAGTTSADLSADRTIAIPAATALVPGHATATQITKLDGIAAGANAYVHPNHSGDVTSVADGAQTIATAVVTLAKMANLVQDKIIGRATASTGVPEAIDCTAAGRALLDDANAAAQLATLGAEEETHAADHAVGAADTVFPADPNADKFLMWDDDPGALVWADAGAGGGVTAVTGTAPIASSGGTTPAISITAATTGAAGSMSSADKTKLDGIEAAADVTDATNVTAAGAIMASVLTERGSIIYRNATIPAELLHGTSGQVLTSGGDGADPAWATPSGVSIDTQAFTSSGTWTKPAGKTVAYVETWSSGGGGGGGRAGNAGSARGGGGGGGGGTRVSYLFNIAFLPATVAVTIDTGGAGGAGGASAGTSGSNGSDGGNTSFGSFIVIAGGTHGNGGTTTTAAGGAGVTGDVARFTGGTGGAGSNAGAAGSVGVAGTMGGGGGGGGGGVTTGNVENIGGVGGAAANNAGGTAGAVNGGAGGNGALGSGGGGGGGQDSGTGGAGGTADPGGGGGGGAGGTAVGGAGGRGGRGEINVWSW